MPPFPQLRDLFAAHALTGLLAWSPDETDEQYSAADAARLAYKHADAMLARREMKAADTHAITSTVTN